MRVLLVSQMYPGPDDPDLGAFVAQLERELERRGHVVARAVVDHRRPGRSKHLHLAADALRSARRLRPDVVYAHFLVPAGLAAALAAALARAPLVVTAHGADVRNAGRSRALRELTRLVTRRAAGVVAVSEFLSAELERTLPELAGRIEVIGSGVDLERFRPRDAAAARARLGWTGEGPAFLFAGSLDSRKNVVRLVDAFARLGRGRLALLGDGPLRAEVENRPGVRVIGRVPHAEVADWMTACDVLCLPSVVEPLGQVLLEAMACGRSVVATSVGGPPELVPPEAGVLVRPDDVESIRSGLEAAAALPTPNPAAHEAAARHDVRLKADRVERLLQRAVAAGA